MKGKEKPLHLQKISPCRITIVPKIRASDCSFVEHTAPEPIEQILPGTFRSLGRRCGYRYFEWLLHWNCIFVESLHRCLEIGRDEGLLGGLGVMMVRQSNLGMYVVSMGMTLLAHVSLSVE